MKRILILLAFLLVAGCTREEEKDWLIGKWHLSGCTYDAGRGKEIVRNAGFKTWEFNEWGMLIVDGDKERMQRYLHRDGCIYIGGVVYDEVIHGKNVMQIERRETSAVTTYTFRR